MIAFLCFPYLFLIINPVKKGLAIFAAKLQKLTLIIRNKIIEDTLVKTIMQIVGEVGRKAHEGSIIKIVNSRFPVFNPIGKFTDLSV